MRRYWQPAALVDQLDGDRPVTCVRLLGETFVLFLSEVTDWEQREYFALL